MQNRTLEDGGNIFGAAERWYDFGIDGCGQGPAMHIVGGGGSGGGGGGECSDLHVYKITLILS